MRETTTTEPTTGEGFAICPFCGCGYDHLELLRLAEVGDIEAAAEWYERVLSEPGNAALPG